MAMSSAHAQVVTGETATGGGPQPSADFNAGGTVTAVTLPPTVNTTPALVAPVVADTSNNNNGGWLAAALPIVPVCLAMFGKGDAFGSTSKNEDNLKVTSQGLAQVNEALGFQKDTDYDRSELATYGADVSGRYSAGSCEQKFIDKNGNLGPWGRTVKEEIRQRPEQFVNNAPPDVVKHCPGYAHMKDEKKREAFWIWVFGALASAESSCDATAKNNKAPNVKTVGPARGLFQIDASFCGGLGVTGNVQQPDTNIRCAVKGLGVELARRDDLTSPTSKGSDSRRTYWGPLRNDIKNKRKLAAQGGAGDAKGHLKFIALLSQFKGCK